MTVRIQFWMALFALGGLMLVGCSTVAPSDASADSSAPAGSKVAAKARVTSAAEQERSIRAHAHFAAGLAYDLNQKSDLALEEYHQAALADPTYEPVVLESARRYLRTKQVEKAIEVLTLAAAQPNASGTIHAWLGLAYAQGGKTNAAIAANLKAIKKMPQALVAYQNLAQIYLQSGKTNQALQVLDQAARQPINDPTFFLDLAELYRRFARSQTNTAALSQERAKNALDRAAKLKPVNPFVLAKLADGYVAAGDLAKAAEVYLEMVKAHPEIPAFRAKLAELYVRNGENVKATEQLEAIAREDPANPQTHFFLGALASEQKQWEKAVASFERAIELNPDLEPAYYELALAKLNADKTNPLKAWQVLEKARARFKVTFALEFYSGIVQAHDTIKNYSAAIKHLLSAEFLAKASEPSRLDHRLYFQLGSAYERSGDLKEAETHFRKCLALEPDSAAASNYLGYMWVDNDMNLEEAKRMIEKAVRLEPENGAYLDSMAWAFYKLKQPQEALTWQLKAIKHTEDDDVATLYDHLGDIYAALNQPDRAREAWQKSLKAEPNEKIQRKLDAAPAASRSPP